MSYNVHFSPIEYLERRRRYYKRKLSKFQNKYLKYEAMVRAHGIKQIVKTRNEITARIDEYTAAIECLKAKK